MIGIFTSLLAAVFGASKDLVSKKVASTLDGTLSAFASFAYAVPFYLILLVVLWCLGFEDFAFSWEFFILVLLRSVTDAAAESLKMHSLTHGDISLVSPFLSLSPLFLLITSPLITGDPVTLVGSFAVVLVVIGAVLIAKSPRGETSSTDKRAIALALGAAFFFSLNNCFDRLAVQVASPTLSGFAMTILAALMILPMLLRQKQGLAGLAGHHRPLLARGGMEVAFMVAKLSALQFLQAPYVAAIMKVSLLISVAGGRIFFNEENFVRRFLASMLIVVGVVVIIYSEI